MLLVAFIVVDNLNLNGFGDHYFCQQVDIGNNKQFAAFIIHLSAVKGICPDGSASTNKNKEPISRFCAYNLRTLQTGV